MEGALSDVVERVERLEDEVYRTAPENPGLSLRLYRIEQLLQVMLRVGAVLGGLGLCWKALDVIGDVIHAKIRP